MNENVCCREKYFNEMDADEKIKKLAEELSQTQKELKKLCEYISLFIDHDHNNGKIMTRIKNPNEESYGGGSFNYRVYDFYKNS